MVAKYADVRYSTNRPELCRPCTKVCGLDRESVMTFTLLPLFSSPTFGATKAMPLKHIFRKHTDPWCTKHVLKMAIAAELCQGLGRVLLDEIVRR